MSNLSMKSIVKVNGGKSMNMFDFADKYGFDINNPDEVLYYAGLLQKQGKLTIKSETSKEQDLINKAIKEEEFQQKASDVQDEQDFYKKNLRDEKASNSDLVGIALRFTTSLEAENFELYVKSLNIENTEISKRNGVVKLFIKDITPEEYNKIKMKYKAEIAIDKTVNTANKAVNNTTNAVNYLATEVVAPVSKIAGEGAINITKGLVHTGVKVFAGLINSSAKAITDTKNSLATDPELIKASNQLINAKNATKRSIRKMADKKMGSNGIEML